MSTVNLREFAERDVGVLNAIRNDKQTLSMMNAIYTKHEMPDETRVWAQVNCSRGGFFIIEYNDVCVGFIKARAFSFGDRAFGHEELGIAISKEARVNGVAQMAVSKYLNSVDGGRFLVRIIEDNIASQKLFAKIGFQEIGRIKSVIKPSDYDLLSKEALDVIFLEYVK